MKNKDIINSLKKEFVSAANGNISVKMKYSLPAAQEELLFSDDKYMCACASLRALSAMIFSIPKEFSGSVLIPLIYKNALGKMCQYEQVDAFDGIIAVKITKNFHRDEYGFGIIDGKKNPAYETLKKCESLSFRKEEGLFVLEEDRLINRAIDDGLNVKFIAATPKAKLKNPNGIKVLSISEGLLSNVTSTRPTPAKVALCSMPAYSLEDASLAPESTILIADNIENPDNLGLIIRTADACGAHAVVCIGNEAGIYHKNCIRASRGAAGRIPLFDFKTEDGKEVYAKLHSLGYKIYGSSSKTENTIYNFEFSSKSAIIVSNETFGISDTAKEFSDEMLKIPMSSGQSSFNVAVASAMLMEESNRTFYAKD